MHSKVQCNRVCSKHVPREIIIVFNCFENAIEHDQSEESLIKT